MYPTKIVFDDPMAVLARVVVAQQGLCLICNQVNARYCGLDCARHPAPADFGKHTLCVACSDSPALYCSPDCAVRGR